MSDIKNISLHVPRSWQELTQPQLMYVLELVADGSFSANEIKAYCLLRFNALRVVSQFEDPEAGTPGQMLVEMEQTEPTELSSHCPSADGEHISVARRRRKTADNRFLVAPEHIAAALTFLDWIDMPPAMPVRLDSIYYQGHDYAAPNADFSDVPYRDYLIADNLFTGYLHTKRADLLDQLTALLYRVPEAKQPFDPYIRYNSFMWFAGLKKQLQSRFTDLFTVTTEDKSTDSLFKQLTEGTDAQIRALTGGDITKEPQVLDTDTIRALTELNAKAREIRQAQSANLG